MYRSITSSAVDLKLVKERIALSMVSKNKVSFYNFSHTYCPTYTASVAFYMLCVVFSIAILLLCFMFSILIESIIKRLIRMCDIHHDMDMIG